MLFQELYRGLSHLVFPQLCVGCSAPLMAAEDTLCLACYQELAHTGYHLIPDNEAAMRFAGRVPYQQVTALAHFTADGLLQHLLHELKYKGRKSIARFLGRELGADLKAGDWAADIDLIVPVPLHPDKERKRGFNQSLLIAEGIGQVLGKQVAGTALKRIRNTESQVRKTREEREINVSTAFQPAAGTALHGRHILLIDDVLTTGATLEAACLALLKIPGIKISIAVTGLASG